MLYLPDFFPPPKKKTLHCCRTEEVKNAEELLKDSVLCFHAADACRRAATSAVRPRRRNAKAPAGTSPLVISTAHNTNKQHLLPGGRQREQEEGEKEEESGERIAGDVPPRGNAIPG